jgi:HK97 gp10 family phage protein
MGNSFEIHIAADNIEQAKQELQQRIRKALTAVGIQTSSLARTELQRSPSRIDTGLLRNSITYALDGEGTAIGSYSADKASRYSGKTPPSQSYSGTTPKEPEGRQAVYIGTGVKYAIYVHEGTDRMAPNRFLKNAVENNQSEIISIIKQELT